MPYAVWIELADPDPTLSDEVARAQRPQLILALIESGGDAEPDEDDALASADEEEPVDLLDVRVVTHPEGARIGVVVDTDELEASLGLGFDLARMLAGSPVLFGWRLESLHGDKLTAPLEPGVWLPRLDEERARFSAVEHLPNELQELAAHYLLAGAAADIAGPAVRRHTTVAAADVVAGSVEHPWGRELVGVLGGLLVAACRAETVHHPLVARGGGDHELATALLKVVRGDATDPRTGFDDDGMRGHVLVDDFMQEHDLLWNRVDDTLTREADDARCRRQLRELLWAGLRVLATLGRDSLPLAETPWVWLAELESDAIDSVVDMFAGRDVERFEDATEHAADEFHAATRAHVLMRLALMHRTLLDTDAAAALMSSSAITEPLHHLGFHTLLALGATAVEQAARTTSSERLRAAAELVLSTLRAVEAGDDEAFDDLHRIIEELLPDKPLTTDHLRKAVRVFLDLIAATAEAADEEEVALAARQLLDGPAELACVLVDLPDDDATERTLRLRILAAVTALDPIAAGQVAAGLPELHSEDPRDEPALRSEITAWWTSLCRRNAQRPLIDEAASMCPEPGASLLRMMSASGTGAEPPLPDTWTVGTAAVAVVHAISALSIAAQDPELPDDIIGIDN